MAAGNNNILINTDNYALLKFLESGWIYPTNTAIEANTVTGLTISRAWWSSDGEITVTRGANTVLSLHGGGEMPQGFITPEHPTTNVVVTFAGNGTLILDVSKQG